MTNFNGIIFNGYGFIKEAKFIRVLNLMNMQSCSFPRPESLINDHDLKLFAAGFAAGKERGWGDLL